MTQKLKMQFAQFYMLLPKAGLEHKTSSARNMAWLGLTITGPAES